MSNNIEQKFTLCWECAKATGGCDWSKNFIPVDGWTATPTIINQVYKKGDGFKAISSYIIHKCPEFVVG